MILIFYLANLIVSLAIMIPIAGLIDSFVGKSLVRERLSSGMDWDFLFEFIDANMRELAGLNEIFLIMPAVFAILILFLSGGALEIFAGSEKYRSSVFWGGCGRYFGRFIRLALMSIPVLAALFSIRMIADLAERVLFGSDPYENVAYWFGLVKISLGFIGLLLFGLVFDYARIYMVVNDERRSRLALWRGLKFAARNILKTFALAFILFLSGVAVTFIYYYLSNIFSSTHLAVIISLIILQQIYIIWRVILRLAYYSSQIDLYRRIAS
jgi:ABC-type multidrug transport system fused ATPase/permease subunit